MAWQLIIAIVVAIPIVVFPAALIWYMNVSGILQVTKDARQREKRRVELSKAIQ